MGSEPPRSVVVVGASAAGLSAADGLRSRGFEGQITIIGEEARPPYDRPPLSKQVLAGAWPPERTALMPPARTEALRARFVLGERTCGLDLVGRVVVTEDGTRFPFDVLVIATGVRPRTLPLEDLLGIHVMRTLDDTLVLKNALLPGAKLVVVGGGFLGFEVAATARQLGIEVTVVEPLARPLGTRLGWHAAARLIDLHRSRGVRVLTGVSLDKFFGSRGEPREPYLGWSGEPGDPARVRGLRLTDGTKLEADVVLIAIGCVPNVEWLYRSGLTIDDGVVCDEYCAAAPGVWAAGDVARWLHVGVGRHVRLEHRMNATEQGDAVAANILGERIPFDPVPFFWTDQYDAKIQVSGFIPPAAMGTIVEEHGDGAFVKLFREREQLVGVLGWNSPRELRPYRAELQALRLSRRAAYTEV